jgi:CRP-like cAMP-binding protein
MEAETAFASALRTSLVGTDQAIEDAIAALRSIVTLKYCDHEQSCDSPDRATLGWVEAGLVRKYVIHANGQRRILDLLMPGDFFGFTQDTELDYSLQAIRNGTRVARCRRVRLLELAARDRLVDQLLHDRSHQAIARLEAHLLAQGRTKAPEKVGAYLLTIARRLGTPAARPIELPISRYDIADHLGIAVETVCRAITDLRHAGVIAFDAPRQIAILDAKGLGEGR